MPSVCATQLSGCYREAVDGQLECCVMSLPPPLMSEEFAVMQGLVPEAPGRHPHTHASAALPG
jgi:hypothetical protein